MTEEGKVYAIVSYITIIGWIIALILNAQKKDEFARYHIRQSLMLILVGFVGSFIFWIPLIGWALAIFFLVLWVMGLVYAIQGLRKPVPLVGPLAQDWFKGL